MISSNGTIQQHFNIGLVRELAVPVPPLPEQEAIVAFLDRETAKIDRLKDVRRRQIEVLSLTRDTCIKEIDLPAMGDH